MESQNVKMPDYYKSLRRKHSQTIDRAAIRKANICLAPKIKANQHKLAESARLGAEFFVGS